MALVIQEYTGNFASVINNAASELNIAEGLQESNFNNNIDSNSLMVEIEGIHAYPHATRNFTRYMPNCLKSSIPSWTKPYRKPVIKHHNEANGETIGRIIDVTYKNNKTLSGTPALLFTANIPDEQAKKEIQNGLLATTSIGVIAHDVRCSICGEHLEDGIMEDGTTRCGHERGQEYDVNGKKEICYWDIYKMEAKELSYVIVPSDVFAKNINIYPATTTSNKARSITEKFSNITNVKGEKDHMDDKTLEQELQEARDSIKTLKESVDSLTKEKESIVKENTSLKEENSSLKNKNKELTESIDTLKEEKDNETKFKEGAENALAETKKELRESRIDNLQFLRKAVGKEALDLEVLKVRTEESIKDSILDLKEELSAKNKKTMPKPGSVKNPGIDNTKNTDEDKKNQKTKPIDISESLEVLLNGLMSSRR